MLAQLTDVVGAVDACPNFAYIAAAAAVIDIGEDVVGVGGVRRAALVNEAGHVTGVVHGARVVITRTLVVVAGLIDKNLDVLVAIVALLGLETEGHAEFGTGSLKISLGCGGAVVVADGDRVVCLRIVIVSDFYLASVVHGDALHSIDITAVNAGSRGEAADIFSQEEAAEVGHLQLVLALGVHRLVPIGIGGGGLLLHFDGLTSLICREVKIAAHIAGSLVGHLGHAVVLPCEGAQVHQTVAHGLSYCCVSTGNGKRSDVGAIVVAGLDAPAIHGPCTLPRQQCCYRQHQCKDSILDL